MQILKKTSRYVTVKMPIQQYNAIIDEFRDDVTLYEFQFAHPTKAASLISV